MSDQNLREKLVWLVKKWRTRVASSTDANEAVYKSCAYDLEAVLAPEPLEKSVACNVCQHPEEYSLGHLARHTHTSIPDATGHS